MIDMLKVPALDAKRAKEAEEDMASILRGEYRSLPWERLRVLLDNKFVEITSPVMQPGCTAPGGSITSLNWTPKGAEFMGQGFPRISEN